MIKVFFLVYNHLVPTFLKNFTKNTYLKRKYPRIRMSPGTLARLSLLDIVRWNILFAQDVSVHETSLVGKISFWKHSYINGPNSYLVGSETFPITIGNYCCIGFNSFMITTNDHIYTMLTNYPFSEYPQHHQGGAISIGHWVWIWAGVTVLPWTNIGNGAVIWAGSVIKGDIPPYAIYAGNPAQLVKYRFDENLTKAIETSKWWEWDIQKVCENYELKFLKDDAQKVR